ncbi:hypothetical protein AAVH_11039 [Aphelenchoides avenae]|nr:hypothetical protein AAVH_11039 [Aphelenchus avenae]
MSTENNATAGRIRGSFEWEANDTVIFISDQGRRIRFRYAGPSLLYPGAAKYQCTRCPITALMINMEFRIVDPCAGHDCTVGAFHPQWTPPTDDAMKATGAQQSSATTASASRSSSPAKNAAKGVTKATYDANGCIQWASERYAGTTFIFRPNRAMPGKKHYFYCPGCARKCDKYKSCLEACGIKRRHLIVSGDNTFECHPDDAGTNQGHLCQQPLLEEKLKEAKALAKAAAQGAPKMVEIATDGNEGANPVPEMQVIGEHSAKLGHPREAKKASALRAEPEDDKTFGKARALPPSALTEAEHLAWSSAPEIHSGPLRDKELVAYQSQKHQRRFKFVLAGPSRLDEYAFDYFCLDCWIHHEEECRVTVSSWTKEFIITDPDRTSSGRHACMQASSAHRSRSPAVANKPLIGLASVEDESDRNEAENMSLVEAPAKSMEHLSERYQAKLKFMLINTGRKGQAYYACVKCRTLQGKLKETGYRRFGYTAVRAHHAIVVDGRFVQRPPDDCGVELFMDGAVECRHICCDDSLKKRLYVKGATCEDRGEPSPKRMRDATHGSTSGLAVRASIHMQSVNGSRADARLHDHSTGQRAGGQAVLKDSAVDQASMEQATTTRYDEGDGQSDDLDFGLTVALQRGDSTYSVSNAAQHAIGPHESGANMSMARLDVKQEQEPHRFHERHEDTSVDDSNNPPPATLKTNDTTRFANSATTSGSSVEVKPPKFPDVVTIDDSDDDADGNGASSTSKVPLKRESVENSDTERERDPAAKFHRFIREFDFLDEYASYSTSVCNSGEPTAFMKQRHVMEKWIKFNQRN